MARLLEAFRLPTPAETSPPPAAAAEAVNGEDCPPVVPQPPPATAAAAAAEEEIPFIEIGPRRQVVDASPSVLLMSSSGAAAAPVVPSQLPSAPARARGGAVFRQAPP